MHPNEERLRSGLQTFSSGDRDAIAEILSPDVVWHVGGDHPLSGDYRGLDAVLAYHAKAREASGGTLRLEPLNVMADDTHGAMFVRVTGRRGTRALETTMAEAFRFDATGRWKEYWALALDQPSVDAFWRE